MSEQPQLTLAQRIAAAILADVTDRRGWRQEWDQFDSDIKVEVWDEWVKVIQAKLDGEPASDHEILEMEIIEEYRNPPQEGATDER